MTTPRIVVAVLAAVAMQTVVMRFGPGVGVNVDFLLVAVVFAALARGPVVGLWTGTVAGVVQDVLSGGLVGVSGLTKSLVGYAAGLVGAQFLVTEVWHRVLVLVAATAVHIVGFVAVYAVIAVPGPAVSWTDVPAQCATNAAAALLAHAFVAHAPGTWERLRRRRGEFAARRWRMG